MDEYIFRTDARFLREQPRPQATAPDSAKSQPISRAEWIAIIGLAIAVIGVVAAWLAVPGFQDWVKGLFGMAVPPTER
jgi:hypothetical protein